MKTINKIRNTICFIIALFLFFSCKDNQSKAKDLGNNLEKNINNESSDSLTKSQKKINLVLWNLVDVTRFFGKTIEETDLEAFKNYRISIETDTIIINNNKAKFITGEIVSQKILGKGSLYGYYTEYVKSKYDIDVTKKFPFLDIDIDDASKPPFLKFFLNSGGALYTNDYLFLYTNDDYLLVYKKAKAETNTNTDTTEILYNKKHNPLKTNYKQFKSSTIKNLEKYSCGEQSVRYIELPNRNDINLILVPQDCGDFPYRYLLLTIIANEVKDNLYVEGEWYEPENDTTKEITTFSIDKNFIINVKTQTSSSSIEEKYTISNEGRIIKN